ncbi:MAG: DNA primase [Candidatus Bathyarchaeota archaeon]|nr:DNA primase [Candidatus Bathyarchaeota archaeon]
MVQYTLPAGMRYATLEEREQFYNQEFALEKVAKWVGDKLANTRFAVIIGRHTGIYPSKYTQDATTTIIIDEYKDVEDVRQQILEFLPEGVYYDRNVYDSAGRIVGQELAFDLDPENITCPIHGSLTDKMKHGQGLSFCELELNMVKQEAVELLGFLEERFSEVRAVYSGRGFHLHVFDHKAYAFSAEERLSLAKLVKQAGFHIDEWVTSGEFRLIRLPYSLNGMVSRIVLPLTKQELETFDAIHDERCLPRFLGKAVTF